MQVRISLSWVYIDAAFLLPLILARHWMKRAPLTFPKASSTFAMTAATILVAVRSVEGEGIVLNVAFRSALAGARERLVGHASSMGAALPAGKRMSSIIDARDPMPDRGRRADRKADARKIQGSRSMSPLHRAAFFMFRSSRRNRRSAARSDCRSAAFGRALRPPGQGWFPGRAAGSRGPPRCGCPGSRKPRRRRG